MPAALFTLMRLRFMATVRRLRRSLSTVRGVLMFAVMLAILGVWGVGLVMGLIFGRPSDPALVRDVAPLILLGATVLMTLGGGNAISFKPAEIDFLFAGPFSRRDLVAYKFTGMMLGTLVAAIVFSLWLRNHATLWIAAFMGAWLAWLFGQLVAVNTLLLQKAIKDDRLTPIARAGAGVAVTALAGCVVLAVIDVARALFAHGTFSFEVLQTALRGSWAGRVVLLPFDALTLTFAAERVFPDLVIWAGVSILMVLLLLGLMLRLDGYFIESSLKASRRLHAKLLQMQKSGGVMPMTGARSGRWKVPALPWLNGAGPVAWVQLTNALRNFRSLLVIIGAIVVSVVFFLMVVTRGDRAEGVEVAGQAWVLAQPAMLGVAAAWVVLYLPTMLRFDFRSESDRMDFYKSMPVAGVPMALGQFGAPVLILTVVDLVLIVTIAMFMQVSPDILVVATLVAIPLNVVLIGTENLVFLLYPHTHKFGTPGDPVAVMRQTIFFVIKTVFMLIAFGGVVMLAVLVTWAVGDWRAGAATAGVALIVLAVLTVLATGRMYERFDPSRHQPEST